MSVLYATKDYTNGLNLYTYCFNNPINTADEGGDIPNWLKWLIGGVVILGLAIATAGIAGVGIGAAFSAGFAGVAIGAGASGLAVTIAAGAFAGALVGAGIGFAAGALIGGLTTGTWQGALDGASNGFMMGAITGALTGGIRSGIAYKNTTPLFRAMSQGEASSIAKSGNFSLKLGEMEGKFFATTKANAMQWGTKFYGESFRVVGTRVLSNGLSNSSVTFFSTLDGIGAAYYFSEMSVLNLILRSLWFI